MGLFSGGNTTESGSKTLLYAGGSQTVLGFAHQAKRRRRLILIGSGVGLVIAGVSGLAAMKVMESQAAKKVVDGYSSLTQCLLGVPLAEGEIASTRFRQMQLTSLTQAEVKRAGDKDGPWPDRCAKYAHVLTEGLSSSSIGKTKGKTLLEASQALAAELDKKDSYFTNLSQAIDKTFDEAKATGLVLEQRPNMVGPPERAQPLTIDALAKEGVVTSKAVALSSVHSQPQAETVIRFVVDDAKSGELKICTVAADSARCDAPPKAAADAAKGGGLRLMATVDDAAAPLLFAGGGAGGVFRVSGDKVDAVEAIGGWAAADGFASIVAPDGGGLKIVTHDGKRSQSKSLTLGKLKLADAKRDAALLWGHVVALGLDGKTLALGAAAVGPKGVGNLEVVGALPKAQLPERGAVNEPRVDGCRAGGSIVARVSAGRDEFVSFWLNGRWTAPLHTASSGGSLTCHAGEAVLTRIDVGTGEIALDAKLTHQRCTPTECRSKSLPVRDILAGEVGLAPSTPLRAVGLDGKVLIVWQAG
jgi:hypothetical protein